MLFLPPQHIWQKKIELFPFTLDPLLLGKAILYEASTTWKKSRQKWYKVGIRKGKKELFHAIRYLDFGIQIATQGKISCYQNANKYWFQIFDFECDNWETLQDKFFSVFEEHKMCFFSCCKGRGYITEEPRIQSEGDGETQKPRAGKQKLKPVDKTPVEEQTMGELTIIEDLTVFNQPDIDVLDVIRDFGLQNFCFNFHVIATRHSKFPNLVHLKSLKFDTFIETKSDGMIIDENQDWKVVCLSYPKFSFQSELPMTTTLPNDEYTVFEKLDGHLVLLYWYNETWQVATKKSPDGREFLCWKVASLKVTLNSLFWKTWQYMGYQLPQDKKLSYMFEFSIPDHRKIVRYPQAFLVFHGARNITTGQEIHPLEISKIYHWPTPRILPEGRNLRDFVNSANPFCFEGFVILNNHTMKRITIKSKLFLLIQCIQTEVFGVYCMNEIFLSEAIFIEMLQKSRIQEFLDYFPFWNDLVQPIIQNHNTLELHFMKEVFTPKVNFVSPVLSMVNQAKKKIGRQGSVEDICFTRVELRCFPPRIISETIAKLIDTTQKTTKK